MKKTVVITGATDGIGKSLAILLSEEYNLALCGRSFRTVANHNYLKPETVARMIKPCIENEEGCVHDIVIRPFIEDNMA